MKSKSLFSARLSILKTILTGWIYIISVLFTFHLSAQVKDSTFLNLDDNSDLEELIEENEGEDFSDDTYNEDLKLPLIEKININFATREELEDLDFLSPIQIQNIIFYRDRFGLLKSPYELLGIEELTMAEIHRIAPYLTYRSSPDLVKPLKEQFNEGKHNIFLRYISVLEEKKGFTPADTNSDGSLTSRYLGIEPHFYARYQFHYSTDLSIGITIDQDSGEPFKHPDQKIGIDYLSGHFFMKNRGVIKKLAVGDFEVNFGQGLFLQQSYSSRKSSYVDDVKKNRNLFKPHTSSNEIIFSRGAAVELKLSPKFIAMVFGSFRKLDANVVFDDNQITEDESVALNVSSIETSGYHRTESELADKGAIEQWSTGCSISYLLRKLRISANGAFFKYSLPAIKESQPYNLFEFSGDRLANAGLDYQFLNKNVSLFGELAFSDNGGWGMLNGGNFKLPNDINLTIVHRYYDKDFHTLYGNAFGESTRPINEHGLYLGISLFPFKYAEWSSYVDIYQHPWLKFGVDAPSHGIDILSKLEYHPKRYLSFYVRGKYERKQENAPDNVTAFDYLVPTTKSSFRLNIQFNANHNITLQSRLELAWYNDGVNKISKGMMLFQDVRYTFDRIPITLNARYALFQTDSYDSRIYTYENDLLYVISIPSYSGRGSRYYINVKYDLNRNIDFWLKWSQTIYSDRDIISSGLEEIQNNVKSEIKLQVRFKF